MKSQTWTSLRASEGSTAGMLDDSITKLSEDAVGCGFAAIVLVCSLARCRSHNVLWRVMPLSGDETVITRAPLGRHHVSA